jgi:hypothetical protein
VVPDDLILLNSDTILAFNHEDSFLFGCIN